MRLAVLIPLMRPHRIAPLVENIRETTEPCNIVVIATGECADAARDLQVTLLEDEGGISGTYPNRINRAFRETTERYLFLGADDLAHHPQWFENALRVLEQGFSVVATNDRNNAAGVHFVVDRQYINEMGGYRDGQGNVLYPGLLHQFCDDALRETARKRGRFAHAHDAIVAHQREWGDPIYTMGEAAGSHDHAVYVGNPDLWQ